MSGALSLAFGSTLVAMPGAQAGATASRILYQVKLPGGQTANVYTDGVAQIYSKDRTKVETRVLQAGTTLTPDDTRGAVISKDQATRQLLQSPQTPYQEGRVLVVFRDGIGASSDLTTVSKANLLAMRQAVKSKTLSAAQIPPYTNDASANRVMAQVGTDRVERLFRNIPISALQSMRSNAQAKAGHSLLNIAGVYRLHVTGASARNAAAQLLKLPSVAYASPDWRVGSMQSGAIPAGANTTAHARIASTSMRFRPMAIRRMATARASDVPANYAVSASAQSMLNAPSDDAAAAFDEIKTKYNQLPGQGEIITNVSLGDLDDASAASNANDPCNFYASVYGPTTIVSGGQRYIDWPSMPLIPAYTSDSSGDLSGTSEVCGVDPYLDEIGLDFSVMAPLPDPLQRSGEQGSGLTDLLGIAPGANYRLVVPGTATPANSDIVAALLGAALQTPRPNVITMSLGFGEDQYGFSARYFEDDPMVEAVVAAVVQSYGIVVCIASGDGVRTYTTVAIGPNGGSTPTNTVASGGNITNINDIAFSGVPSQDYDSGAIDVGGTTLDDVFAVPPQYAASAAVAQHAYPETRWTGFTNFASGDGTRVNVSAPSDNIVSFEHNFGSAADGVEVVYNGGTSASAPETAAASAVVLQIARLTGHPMTPAQVRSFLASTGTTVPPIPQTNKAINVGPQIDVRRAVETLLTNAGAQGTPNVPRVAIEQRRNEGNLDGFFESDTDPTDILLQDPTDQDRNQVSWITIAPDWEWLPAGTTYRLYVTGHTNEQLATTPWARALPKTIFAAAGIPLAGTSNRTISLTYDALNGGKTIATSTFSLTFGPTDPTHYGLLAPHVPSTVTGTSIPVTYDLRNIAGVNAPEVVVSEPGRMSPSTGQLFHPIYTASISGTQGTINVPVSSLQGGGEYGVDVIYDSVLMRHSDPAFVRVAPSNALNTQASAPLLASNGSTPGHYLEIPYGSSFQVSYDVSNLSSATGAMLEISAAGPGSWGIYNPFNNPGGSICDNNGVDAGSVYCVPVNGTKGTVTLNGTTAGLVPTLNQVVRVIPMNSGAPAGEAGEVSDITMDGVATTDGGGVQNGFGVDQAGLDGFLTSGQQTASGEILTSLETFDQTSNQVIQNVGSTTGYLYFSEGASGIFGGDIALLGLQNYTTNATTYNLLDTVENGTVGSAWTPPSTVDNFVSEAAENTSTDTVPMYFYDPNGPTNDNYRLFTTNIVKNWFSPIYDISGPIESETLPNIWGFAEDTHRYEAYAIGEDFLGNCVAPTIVTTNLETGAVSSFAGVGAGYPYGVAIDSATDRAAVPTLCDGGLSIYNLNTKKGTEYFLDGNPSPSGNVFNGLYTENDSPNGRFLVEQTTAPDFGANNNSLSRVLVYDESGNLLEKKEQFDLFGAFVSIQAHNLQVDPAKHFGYLIGPLEVQLEPFTY